MTDPLHVDPGELNAAGGRWYVWIPGLQGSPPASGSGWPSGVGAAAVTGVAAESTAVLQSGLARTAGSAQSGAAAYQSQDGLSGDSLKDFTSMMSDMIGAGTSLVQAAPQLVQSVTSAVSSAASGGASAVSSLVSTLTHSSSAGSPIAGGNAPQVALPAIDDQNQPEGHRIQQQQQQDGG